MHKLQGYNDFDIFQVVGRGGQAILAFISWRAFVLYVTTSMETAPVAYSSFQSFFMQSGPSLSLLGRVTRDFIRRKGLHSRLAMVFIIVSIIFTLAFPTLASAMTGYTSFLEAYVPDHQNENYIRFDMLKRVLYVIHDGQRINQTNDYLVIDGGVSGEQMSRS